MNGVAGLEVVEQGLGGNTGAGEHGRPSHDPGAEVTTLWWAMVRTPEWMVCVRAYTARARSCMHELATPLRETARID